MAVQFQRAMEGGLCCDPGDPWAVEYLLSKAVKW